jgi:hypothetical protein
LSSADAVVVAGVCSDAVVQERDDAAATAVATNNAQGAQRVQVTRTSIRVIATRCVGGVEARSDRDDRARAWGGNLAARVRADNEKTRGQAARPVV